MTGPTGPLIAGARYEGFDLATKYGWMQQGRGADAVTGGLHYLKTVTEDLTNINAELGAQLAKLGVTWSGPASVAATGGLTDLAGYAEDTHEVTRAGGDRLADYAGSFARLRSAIPKPVDVGEQSWAGAVLDGVLGEAVGIGGIQSDYRRRMLHQRELDAQANRALYAHERSTREILASFTVAQPPPNVLAAAVPGPRSTRTVPQPSAPQSPGPQSPGPRPPIPSPGATGARRGPARPDTDASTWPSAGSGETAGNTDLPGAPEAAHRTPDRSGGPPGGIPPGGIPPAPGLATVPGRPDDGPRRPSPRGNERWGNERPGNERSGRHRENPAGGAAPPEPSTTPRRPGGAAGGARYESESLREAESLREVGPLRGAEPLRAAVAGSRDGPVPPPRSTGTPGVLPPSVGYGRAGERDHRNNHFLPSDEPFDVPVECYRDYAPPVLGRD